MHVRKLRRQEGKSFPQEVPAIGSRVGVCFWFLYHMLLPNTHADITFVSQILGRMLVYKKWLLQRNIGSLGWRMKGFSVSTLLTFGARYFFCCAGLSIHPGLFRSIHGLYPRSASSIPTYSMTTKSVSRHRRGFSGRAKCPS